VFFELDQHVSCFLQLLQGLDNFLFRPLALGDVLVYYLKLSFNVPEYVFAEDLEIADFTIFPYDTYFIFGRPIIPFSFFPSYLKLCITLWCIAILDGCRSQFLNAVVAIDIQNSPVGING